MDEIQMAAERWLQKVLCELHRVAGPGELRIPVGNKREMIHMGTMSRGRR